MCLFNQQKPEDPQLPPEYAAMREPDQGAVRANTGKRTTDKLRAGTDTILTSGSGVTAAAPTDKKTLLGQ
jgi:hypothetical protein